MEAKRIMKAVSNLQGGHGEEESDTSHHTDENGERLICLRFVEQRCRSVAEADGREGVAAQESDRRKHVVAEKHVLTKAREELQPKQSKCVRPSKCTQQR